MRLSIQLYTDMIASSQSLARDARDPLSVFAEAADGAGTAHSGAHGGHRLPLSRWEAAGARRQQARAPAAAQGTSARAWGDRAAGSFRPCDTVQRLNGRWGRSPSPPPRVEWIDGCRQPFQPVAATVPFFSERLTSESARVLQDYTALPGTSRSGSSTARPAAAADSLSSPLRSTDTASAALRAGFDVHGPHSSPSRCASNWRRQRLGFRLSAESRC